MALVLTQNPQLRHSSVQAEEHPEGARVVHAHLHPHVGAVVAEDDLPFLVDQEAQDVAALQRRRHAAHGPELLSVHQSLWVVRQVAGAQHRWVAGGHAVRQGARAHRAGLGDLDEDGLSGAQGPVGEDQRPFLPGVLRPGHCLLVQRLDVGAAQLVEVQVALQGRRQQGGLLRVQGILGNGAGGGGGRRGQVQRVAVRVGGASVLLLQVEIAQADGEAGVVGLAPQGGGAHRGEGAWAQAVRRNDLTVCKTETGTQREGEQQLNTD